MKSSSLFTRAWMLALATALMLMALGATALAERSPAGYINDESGTLTAGQLTGMDTALKGLKYQYRVVIVPEAFDGPAPADANARFEQRTIQLLTERQIPQDAVLINIALKERMVQFRVWRDGPINAAFQQQLGRDFGSHSDVMLNAFKGPAGKGDIPGGIHDERADEPSSPLLPG